MFQVSHAARGRGRRNLSDMLRTDEKSPVSRRSSGGSLFGTTEIAQDFVMVDLKTPFAAQASGRLVATTECCRNTV